MKKFKSRDSPGPKVNYNHPAPTVTNFNSNQKKHFSLEPIEVVLSNICPKNYGKIGQLISMVKQFGEPTDCKFTNETKTEAYLRYKCMYEC